MTGTSLPALAAIVVASEGGRIASTLAAVAWAEERVVVDPCGRMAGVALPPGVRCVPEAAHLETLVTASWVLLVEEGEVPGAGLAAEVARVCGGREEAGAWRVPRELRLGRVGLQPRTPPVRLAARARARLAVRADGTLTLGTTDAVVGTLAAALVPGETVSVGSLMSRVDASTTSVAAVLMALDAPARRRDIVVAPLLGGVRVLRARAASRCGWARWILAVFAAYGALVAYAKLWERRVPAAGARTW
ncbi:MAG: hypothetical protein U0807_03830 [Candidatus Binatia bacterium]